MRLIPLLFVVFGLFSIGSPLASSADLPRLEIDQVEFEGVTVLSQSELESSLLIGPGDVIDRISIVKSADNIRTLYGLRGYKRIGINSELMRRKDAKGKDEIVLKYTLKEGVPTRISTIKLFLAQIPDQMFHKKWPKLESEILAQIKVQPGHILDQDKISASRIDAENVLASEEYIGARFDDIRITPDVQPTDLDPALYKNTADWAAIEIYVYPGEKVVFGFRGNNRLTRNELMELVEDQRALGFGQGYIEAIRTKIIDKYKSIGYAKIDVEVLTFEKPGGEGRHITYKINEGSRIQIENVDFDGNMAFNSETLKEKLFELSPPLVERGYYVEKDVETASALLLEWLKSEGFLSAKIVAVNKKFSENGKRVKLTVFLYEGVQTIVERIEFRGVQAFSTDELKDILKMRENKPLNLIAFNGGIENLKEVYKNKGYLDVQILNESDENVIQYSRNNRQAIVTLNISEGHLYRVSHIEVLGLTKTNPGIVRRELQFKENEILEGGQISESEEHLRKMGIFSSVAIEHRNDPDKFGYKQMFVHLTEGEPGNLSGGIGVRNDLGVRLFSAISYASIWHRNHTGEFSGSVNRRFEDFCVSRSEKDVCFLEYQMRLGYIWPWFLIDEATLRPSITQEKNRFKQFDAQTTSFKTTFDRKLFKTINLIGAFTYSLERTMQFNAESVLDNQNLTIGSVIPSLSLDLRDNPLVPISGFYTAVSYEIASTAFGSQSDPFPIGYTRLQYRADQFIPVSKNITWFLSARTGFERNTIQSRILNGQNDLRIGIPLSKQFALGGAGSLRGFKPQELNVQDKVIQGTLSYVNYRTQLDLPFAGEMRFGPFFDAANLMVDTYSLGHLRYGAGFGFHYQTPVGPVSFDWGFKLNPLPGEDPYAFYFSVGNL